MSSSLAPRFNTLSNSREMDRGKLADSEKSESFRVKLLYYFQAPTDEDGSNKENNKWKTNNFESDNEQILKFEQNNIDTFYSEIYKFTILCLTLYFAIWMTTSVFFNSSTHKAPSGGQTFYFCQIQNFEFKARSLMQYESYRHVFREFRADRQYKIKASWGKK